MDGGEDFPQLCVPRQSLELCRTPEVHQEPGTVLEVRGKPEVSVASEGEEPEGSDDTEVESIFHTFYTFRDDETLVVYTKHFSRSVLILSGLYSNVISSGPLYLKSILWSLLTSRHSVRYGCHTLTDLFFECV